MAESVSSRRVSRRRLLRAIGLGAVGTGLACGVAGYLATRPPAIETPAFRFPATGASGKRVLVTYATRAGSTVEVAAAIGEALSVGGHAVDVLPVRERPDVTGYDVIVMGSPVRMGRWLPEATEYVQANQGALRQRPVALYTVHMQNRGDDEASRAARLAYLADIRPLLHAPEEVYFLGKMDLARLSALDRLVARMVGAVDEDLRDWDRIRSWVPAALG